MKMRLILNIFICIEFIFSPPFGYKKSYADSSLNFSTGSLPSQNPDQQDGSTSEQPPLSDEQRKLLTLQEAYENRQPLPIGKKINPFRLVNQERVLRGSPSQVGEIRTSYSEQEEKLSFTGIQGENKIGANGFKVAVQTIPEINVKAIAESPENPLISIIDSQGRLSLIDRGFIKYAMRQENFFPIPIVTDVWVPLEAVNLEHKIVKADYIRRGLTPIPMQAIHDSKIPIPHNEYGEPVFNEWDLIVTYYHSEDEAREGRNMQVLGIFSHDVSLERIKDGYHFLIGLTALASPEYDQLKRFENNLQSLEKNGFFDAQWDAESLAPDLQVLIKNYGVESLDYLRERVQIHSQSQNLYNNYDDQFTYEEWLISNQEILEKAKQKIEGAQGFEREIFKYRYSPTNLKHNWRELITSDSHLFPFQIRQKDKLEREKKDLEINRPYHLDRIMNFFKVGTVLYLLYPLLHDPYLIQYQISFLNAIYEISYPDVLKDATYRIPLLMSMTSLVSILPSFMGMVFLSQKIMGVVNERLQSSQTRIASSLREMHKKWSNLDTWQTIQSFAMRFYTLLFFPIWIWIPQYILRQKSLLSALNYGLSPFAKIKNGNNETIGWNNPFLSPNKLKEVSEHKHQHQIALYELKKRKEAMAWKLGALIAAERTNIDPVTLELTLREGLSPMILRELIQNPEKRRKWFVAAEEFRELLQEMDLFVNSDFSLDPKLVDVAIEEYTKIGNRIQKYSSFKKSILDLKVRFRHFFFDSVQRILNLGMDQIRFLRSNFISKQNSQQIKQDFIPNYLLSILVYGLWGARADLNQPEALFADPNGFLWTRRAQLYDVTLQLYTNLFLSGARVSMIYQNDQQPDHQQYLPVEDLLFIQNKREQKMTTSLSQWLGILVRPWKSDVGGLMVRKLFRNLSTIQAGIMQSLFFRSTVGGQNLSHSLAGWALWFEKSQWIFGFIKDFVYTGNNLLLSEIGNELGALHLLQVNISKGLRRVNSQEPQSAYHKSIQDLLELYRENSPEFYKELKQLLPEDFFSGNHSDENVETLLSFSLSKPPIETNPHPWFTSVTTFVASIATLILASKLSVQAFDENYLTFDYIVKWFFISFSLYVGSYYLLGKKSWDYLFSRYDRFKEQFKGNDLRNEKKQFKVNDLYKDVSSKSLIFCQNLLGLP